MFEVLWLSPRPAKAMASVALQDVHRNTIILLQISVTVLLYYLLILVPPRLS